MTEISTLITDYMLGAFTAVLGAILTRHAERDLPVRLWSVAFIALALAAFAGGTSHGFQPTLGDTAEFWLWKVVILFVGVFGLASMSGSVLASFTGTLRKALLSFVIVICVLYGLLMIERDDFIYVNAFNATAMALVLAVHAFTWITRRDPSSPWMIAGIVVSGMAALVQASGLSLHRHFNHNDLFHVIQIAGVWLLYRGARELNTGT